MVEDRDSELSELLDEVRRIEVQSNRLVNDMMAGGYSSVFRGQGIEFDEVREYVDGDDPRSVDWNVTARMGRPYIKKYVDERELTVIFLIDLSASMAGSFGPWSARQMAARIIACLAFSAAVNNDKVGMIAFSRDVERYVPPDKGVRHVLRIIRDCLALPGEGSRTDLVPALEFTSSVIRRRAVLFLVSDFLADGWKNAMTLCARRHDLIAVRLLPPELARPGSGLVRMRDPESALEATVDWRRREARDAYQERVDSWHARTRGDLGRAKVDLMDVAIPREPDREAVARPILDFFRMREQRGAKR